MPVSFISKALRSDPYIAPIDQNLAFGAQLYKQQKFDQGVAQTDALLQNISEQEILNPAHKAYYDQKVAEVTDQVNKLGGADFSERDTLQQIGSLSATVSRDPRILAARADTQRIRQAQDQMKLWKSDPKKYGNAWAVQNQYDLDSQIGSYLKDGSETAHFAGEATSYFDHGKLINDRLTSIRKQIQSSGGYQTTDGQYISTTKNLSDLAIRRIVEGEMASNPAIGRQMSLDATYQYRNLPADDTAFRASRVQQLRGVKGLLEKQADNYNNQNLLLLKTGTPEQQKVAEASHIAGLQAIRDQLNGYDEQIRQAGITPREEQIQSMHRESQLLGYQAKYALSERTQRADPNYGVNLAHQDRQAALKQNNDQFIIREANDNSKTKGGWQHDLDMLDKEYAYKAELFDKEAELKLGLARDKSGKYSAAGADKDFTTVDLGASGIRETGLPDLYQARDLTAGQQNKAVQDLLVSYIRTSNRGMADELGRQFKAVSDKDGNLQGFRYPKTIAPNVASAAKQVYDYYDDMINGRPLDPAVAAQLDNPESRALLDQIKEGSMVLKIQQKQLTDVHAQAKTRSGMNPAELSELARLQTLKQKQPELFDENLLNSDIGGWSASRGTPLARLKELETRYQPAVEAVAGELGRMGQYNRGFLVTGDSAKEGSPLQRLVQNRISQQAVDTSGATNAERRAALAGVQGRAIQQMTVDPSRQQVHVRTVDKDGLDPKSVVVDFTGTADWNSVLSEQLRQQQNGTTRLLQDYLDKEGSLKVGKQPLLFTTRKGAPLAITPSKTTTGRYDLGYMYQGVQLPLPMEYKNGRAFVPMTFQTDPIGWSRGQLDTWLAAEVYPKLQTLYGTDPQTGKPIPGYKPSLADLNRFFSDKDIF